MNYMMNILNDHFTKEEVFEALQQMNPTKEPVVDGTFALFYQCQTSGLNNLTRGGELSFKIFPLTNFNPLLNYI